MEKDFGSELNLVTQMDRNHFRMIIPNLHFYNKKFLISPSNIYDENIGLFVIKFLLLRIQLSEIIF